jgi:hypothetical protein
MVDTQTPAVIMATIMPLDLQQNEKKHVLKFHPEMSKP